jgi:hypothetical protein
MVGKKLRLTGMIATRYTVQCLAEEHKGVTDIDFTNCEFVGFTAMHQLLISFPDATLTGMTGFVKEQYDAVIEVTGSDEWKNQGGEK